MAGRPSKFTPSVVAAILDNLRHGSPRGRAANAAGVSESTFFYWYAHGNEYQCEFNEFSDDSTRAREMMPFDTAVRMAEAVFVSSTVKRINKISETHWEASAWILERRFPEQFGRRSMSDASIENIQAEIESILAKIENPGGAGGEQTNLAAINDVAVLAHRNYLGSYLESDARLAENRRDAAFSNLLAAFNELRAQVDHTISA